MHVSRFRNLLAYDKLQVSRMLRNKYVFKSGRRRDISLNYFKRSTLRFENEVNLFSYQSEEQFYIPNRDTNMKGRIIIGEESV